MGFINKIFNVLGFESNTKDEKQKQKKGKKVKASYNFKRKQNVERVDNIDGVKVVYPEVFADTKKYIDYIKDEEPLIICIDFIQDGEFDKIIFYLTGAVQMAGGKCVVLEKDKYYILLPEGMEIEE